MIQLLLVWPHEVMSLISFLVQYKGGVQTRPQMLNIISVALFELSVWPHEVEPWFHSQVGQRPQMLNIISYLSSSLFNCTEVLLIGVQPHITHSSILKIKLWLHLLWPQCYLKPPHSFLPLPPPMCNMCEFSFLASFLHACVQVQE